MAIPLATNSSRRTSVEARLSKIVIEDLLDGKTEHTVFNSCFDSSQSVCGFWNYSKWKAVLQGLEGDNWSLGFGFLAIVTWNLTLWILETAFVIELLSLLENSARSYGIFVYGIYLSHLSQTKVFYSNFFKYSSPYKNYRLTKTCFAY